MTPPLEGNTTAWPGALLALVGSVGVAAAWVAVAVLGTSQCGWMAVIAALDAAWLLRQISSLETPVSHR